MYVYIYLGLKFIQLYCLLSLSISQCVFKEIQKVFYPSPNINYEELSKLHYCEVVIKEG